MGLGSGWDPAGGAGWARPGQEVGADGAWGGRSGASASSREGRRCAHPPAVLLVWRPGCSRGGRASSGSRLRYPGLQGRAKPALGLALLLPLCWRKLSLTRRCCARVPAVGILCLGEWGRRGWAVAALFVGGFLPLFLIKQNHLHLPRGPRARKGSSGSAAQAPTRPLHRTRIRPLSSSWAPRPGFVQDAGAAVCGGCLGGPDARLLRGRRCGSPAALLSVILGPPPVTESRAPRASPELLFPSSGLTVLTCLLSLSRGQKERCSGITLSSTRVPTGAILPFEVTGAAVRRTCAPGE